MIGQERTNAELDPGLYDRADALAAVLLYLTSFYHPCMFMKYSLCNLGTARVRQSKASRRLAYLPHQLFDTLSRKYIYFPHTCKTTPFYQCTFSYF